MKPKFLRFSFPNLPHQKRSCLFGPGEQILDQIKTICSQQDKFGNDTKTFWFRFQNDIGLSVFSLLTLLTAAYETKSYEKGFPTSAVCVGLLPETGAVLLAATSKNTLLKRLIFEVFRVPNLRLY